MTKKSYVFTIKKSKISSWGYEITCGDWFHNIAPSVEIAIDYLKDRYGSDVKYRVLKQYQSAIIADMNAEHAFCTHTGNYPEMEEKNDS